MAPSTAATPPVSLAPKTEASSIPCHSGRTARVAKAQAVLARPCGVNSQIYHAAAGRTACSSSASRTASVAKAHAVFARFRGVSSPILHATAGCTAFRRSYSCTVSVPKAQAVLARFARAP